MPNGFLPVSCINVGDVLIVFYMLRLLPRIPFSQLILYWALSGIVLVSLFSGCSGDMVSSTEQCNSCHTVDLDPNHQIACTSCHSGNGQAGDEQTAHKGMLSRPAHPNNLAHSCGQCHTQEANNLPHALHYTLSNSINQVRTAFGASDHLASLIDIPINEEPENITQLADDMLRRRCLRCHLFSPGDTYSATRRGTGCAACHLEYKKGKLVAHVFKASPADNQCLACHYGNRVGADYYGRFEYDFSMEFRTPYTAADTTDRPYGVEYHDLVPDIHQQRGLICIDCHSGRELMTARDPVNRIACADCHDSQRLRQNLPRGIEKNGDTYYLIAKGDGKKHSIPLLRHPAHSGNTDVTCQVCHAQWSFNDGTTYLLRSDMEEYDRWAFLTVQGSSEVEHLLANNLDFDKDELEPSTTDTITNEKRRGIWYKGYSMRRWESIPFGRTENGRISVMRPELNISLSWIDENEDVRFDGVDATAANHGLRPYTPHTTGPAGIFYKERLRQFRATDAAMSR